MLYVDRIEEGKIVCEDEDGSIVVLSDGMPDRPVHEGDCLVSAEDGQYRVDEAATAARRERLSRRYRELFRNHTR